MEAVRSYILSDIIAATPRTKDIEIVIRSTTDRNVKYTIRYSHLLHRLTCTCPDWIYRRMNSGEDCKHIRGYLNGEYD